MPHLVVEYAKPLEEKVVLQAWVDQLFSVLAQCGVFQPDTIIVRAHACSHYHAGSQQKDFIHLTLSLYEGRTAEQLTQVQQLLAQQLELFSSNEVTKSLRFDEMAKSHYIELD